MKTTVTFSASHPEMNRDEIQIYFDLGETFVLSPMPARASENWKSTVLMHMCCWHFLMEGKAFASDPLLKIYEVLFQKKERLVSFVKGGGKTDVCLIVSTGRSWGDEISPELLVALGRLGVGLGLQVFLSDEARSA